MKWSDVFKAAAKVAAQLRAKNPKLTQPEAMSQAFKSPAIVKLRDEYNKSKAKKGKCEKKEGGLVRSLVRKRKNTRTKKRGKDEKEGGRVHKKRTVRAKRAVKKTTKGKKEGGLVRSRVHKRKSTRKVAKK